MPPPAARAELIGQHRFCMDLREYKHEAQASVFERIVHTRLRLVLVWPTKVTLFYPSVAEIIGTMALRGRRMLCRDEVFGVIAQFTFREVWTT